MRIDKFLWAVRLYKTRSLATKDCTADKVKLNGSPVKPAKEVQVGDEVSVKMNPIWRKFRVINLPKNRVAAKLVEAYLEETTAKNDLETLHQFQSAMREQRLHGAKGRPTKKERRDLNKLRP